MRKFWSDRNGVTSLEYALLAAALGVVLLQVLQVPVQTITDFAATAVGGHGGGGTGGSGASR